MKDVGLQALVDRHFGFLVSDMGFTKTERTPCRVRFESPAVFVEMVFDGHRSYELCLWIGQLGSQAPPFSIDEILRLRGAPDASSFSLVQVKTEAVAAAWLEKLAGALRLYGREFLAGNTKCFEEISEMRRREVQGYALDRELRSARAKAEAAWLSKDYAGVVQALQPLRGVLTPAEMAKVKYAQKHAK